MYENSKRKTITLVHLEDITAYPPVMNVLKNFLCHSHKVNLISCGTTKLPAEIRKNNNIKIYDISLPSGNSIHNRLSRSYKRKTIGRKLTRQCMQHSDVLWTTTDLTVEMLGKMVLEYRHVMQLMELIDHYPRIRMKYLSKLPFAQFPIKNYGRKAWKVVVPEKNRAYIQKTWWDLKETPYVLPNKPYDINVGEPDLNEMKILEEMQEEKRKIILFQGNLSDDRDLSPFAEAIKTLGEEYCLYVMGKSGARYVNESKKLFEKYPFIKYIGYFTPPKHLLFTKYAHIGLLPYIPSKNHLFLPDLNALYCAPNKIYEYSAFGVPMLGTDVPGLTAPFEKYNIGVSCKKLDAKHIVEAVKKIDGNYAELSQNCKRYFVDTNLDEIVEKILYEEE